MKDELEVFENRSDDWLAKERVYEKSVSVWDFDDGKKLKTEHNKNCDANYIKTLHEKKHQAYNASHKKGVVNDNSQFQSLDSVIAKKFVVFILFIAASMFSIVIDVITGDVFATAIPIIIFVLLVNMLSNKKGRNKK